MIPPLLTKELRALGISQNGEMLGMTTAINEVLEKTSSNFAVFEDEKKEDRQISDRSLARALDPNNPLRKDSRRDKTKVERLLARFVILKTYEQVKLNYPSLTFSRYNHIKTIDLLSDSEKAAEIDLWKLDGNWKIFVAFESKQFALPAHMTYEGFDYPLNLKMKYFDGRNLEGCVQIGYSGKNSIPTGELRLESSDANVSFVARTHLAKLIPPDELVITGSAIFNIASTATQEPLLFTSPVVMVRNFGSKDEFENINIYQLRYFIPEDKLVNEKNPSDTKIPVLSSSRNNNIYNFIDRRRSFSTNEFSPANFWGLENYNSYDKALERQFSVPQKPASYESLKQWFGESIWYSLSRISESTNRLSLTRYEFKHEDDKRNFYVKRYNQSRNSDFRGFIDRIGSDIYILLRDKTESRNRMVMVDLKGDFENKINVYCGLGVSKHDNQGLAWRELLFRFSNETDVKEHFGKFIHKDYITYDEFLELKPAVIDEYNKLYLANRGQSTLSFPTTEGSVLMRYQRQTGALPYCDRTYFIYMKYPYSDEYELFRLKQTINDLAQAITEVKYPNSEQTWIFHGDVTLVNDTLRISVFNPNRQQMNMLFNIHEKVIDRSIVLDGIVLCTDKYGKSISYTCVLLESEIMTPFLKDELNQPGIVEVESDEHNELLRVVESRFLKHLDLGTIKKFQFKYIHPYEMKDR